MRNQSSSQSVRVASAPAKPLMIFDGDCGFCRRWIVRWHKATGNRVGYASSQESAAHYPEIAPEAFQRAVQLVETDGSVFSGAAAVFKTLSYVPGKTWLYRLYRNLPGFAFATDLAYKFVARNRPLFGNLTTWLWGRIPQPSTFYLGRWIFLRGLGLTYLIAFVSLGVQVQGLIGSQGILPIEPLMAAARQHYGPSVYQMLPTLAWFGASDHALTVLWVSGAVASIALMLGFMPVLASFASWALYLSFVGICRDFLGFQWDNLLLEIGFLAIFLAPMTIFPRLSKEKSPPAAIHWLLRWLLFRLMFSSGFVKLASGDIAWHKLKALRYHYETQPLPTPVAWYFHQAPGWFQDFSTLLVLFLELAVPFLLFLPRRPRHLAAVTFIVFQLLIFITGNYCFFNILTILLCILMLDDQFLHKFMASRFWNHPIEVSVSALPWKIIRSVIAAGLWIASVSYFVMTIKPQMNLPAPVVNYLQAIYPFRSVNTYGLFAVMTTERPEIIIEGSADGRTWKEYEFKWKPGDVTRRPRFVEPHQPRLDWQMWFEALGGPESSQWFPGLLRKLLEGSPTVTGLFASNPFPDAPPLAVRALLYKYTFTTPAERRQTGAWWKREFKGVFYPAVSLKAAQPNNP